MLALLPAPRAAALTDGPVTIDLDTTDVEVYGRKKRGVAYNHQGQRVGRPHVAAWAETEIVLAADLGDGTDDPRATAPDLLRRALAALPAAARASGRVAMRADAGYFAGQLARAAHDEHISFAIGAKRIAPLWRLLAGIAEDDWHDAIDMDGAQVAVAEYCPDWWPANTRLLIRRVLLDTGAGLRRPAVTAAPHPAPRTSAPCRSPSWPAPGRSTPTRFILTNLDVSSPDKAVAAEHWYRHRTTVENIFRDSKHGAALRHLPSRIPPGQYWPGCGARCSPRAWPPGCTSSPPSPRGQDHPGRARRARRQGHDRHPALAADRRPRPADPPRPPPDPAAAARPQPAPRGPGPAAGPARPRLTTLSLSPGSPSLTHGPPAPTRRKARKPRTRRRHPGHQSCPLPGNPAHQDHLPRDRISSPRYSRNRGKRRDKPAWRRRWKSSTSKG